MSIGQLELLGGECRQFESLAISGLIELITICVVEPQRHFLIHSSFDLPQKWRSFISLHEAGICMTCLQFREKDV